MPLFFFLKRKTSVTLTLAAMQESAQKQMELTFAPVWRDTRDPIAKVTSDTRSSNISAKIAMPYFIVFA